MLELSQIAVSLDAGVDERSCSRAARRAGARLLRVRPADLVEIELRRRSVDARRRSDIHLALSVRVRLRDGIDEVRLVSELPEAVRRRVRVVTEEHPCFPAALVRRAGARRPVVVGAGCAGLFCALALAEAGREPLLIERGEQVDARARSIERFETSAVLDPESNIQFGLGGAGTFSDGKLSTGTRDPAHRLILETLVDAGAPREILWDAKPHIGSDLLPAIVDRLAGRIRALGGELRYGCRLVDIERRSTTSEDEVRAVTVELRGADGAGEPIARERIVCDGIVLACGHSARDIFELLSDRGFLLRRKTFAMGVRIEHRQAAIDRALFGRAAGHRALGAGSYRLVAHLPGGRSLFSFCMCPGGEVVAAASELGGVVTNGASGHARGGENANAALLVNVTPDDLPGDDPLAGVALQRRCERVAFELGGGRYRAPAQLVGDFLAGVPSTGGGSVAPTYPLGVTWSALDSALPDHIVDALRAGLPALDRKLAGFAARDAVLTGVETRSSSPITVVRDERFQAIGAPGIFPCGEGAGYAGGIMSAAADGIRCAEALIACR